MQETARRRHLIASCAAILVIVSVTAIASPLGRAEDAAVPQGQADLDGLVAAYPDLLAGREDNQLLWRDGTRMPIDDGIDRVGLEARLEHADITDQLAMPYSLGPPAAPPGVNEDPGRIRYEPFFDKMYGDCRKGGVTPDLVPVAWLPGHHGGRVMITRINGIDKRLAEVSAELDKLPESFMRYLIPTAGTFNCRVIAGTDRVSMHAYGAAIDINTRSADYWRNAKGTSGRLAYHNAIPFEIVDIFERHGFIWGGKWYHYDTMHFEYRPELTGFRPPAAQSQ